jgi:hypothetical protein
VGRPQAQPSGWRRLFGAFGGGGADELSAEEREQEKLLAQVKTPLPDGHRLAVISLKGGVGKTTGDRRARRHAGVDAHRPRRRDRRQPRPRHARRQGPAHDAGHRPRPDHGPRSIGRYATLQRYVNRTPSRLEVLASEADPAASHAFDEADYAAALDMLERFYNIILTDCGTGLLHAATRARPRQRRLRRRRELLQPRRCPQRERDARLAGGARPRGPRPQRRGRGQRGA